MYPISATIPSLPHTPDCLSASKWKIISDYIHILNRFEIMISESLGENYPTLIT